MKRIRHIIEEIKDLQRITELDIIRMENLLKTAPSGTLQTCTNTKLQKQHYIRHYSSRDQKDQYLRKTKDWQLIEQLGDKRYAKIALKNLRSNQQAFEYFLKRVTPDVGEKLANNLSAKMIPTTTHTCLPFDEYAGLWLKEPDPYAYRMKNMPSPDVETLRGDFVRSKSEALIANILYTLKLPYKYETGLRLNNPRKILFPDFLILNPFTNEICIYEHFGKMDDLDYADRTFEKIDIYEQNGYKLGRTFIYTFETGTRPLSSSTVQRTINQILY